MYVDAFFKLLRIFNHKVYKVMTPILFGWTAFHSACKIGYSEMAESLIERFPDLAIDLKWS